MLFSRAFTLAWTHLLQKCFWITILISLAGYLGDVVGDCNVAWCSTCAADPKVCTECNAPYYGLTADGTACERCRSGCLLCTRLSKCDVCLDPTKDGPVLDASGTCRPCASDCSYCGLSGNGKCDLCQPGFRLLANKTCQGSAPPETSSSSTSTTESTTTSTTAVPTTTSITTTTTTTTTTTITATTTTTTTTTSPTSQPSSPTTSHATTCSSTQFQCRNGQCASLRGICDGTRDCMDGSDELNCGVGTSPSTPIVCNPSTYFTCNTTHRCVRLSWKCDGYNDCGDDSDELNCVCNRTNQFECVSPHRCISLARQCDSVVDCLDRSDETNCSCDPLTQFQCGTNSPRCIPLYSRCDLINDCLDGSDEMNCPCAESDGKFRCDNTRCVSLAFRCNFIDDCLDGSDETHCIYPACNDTQFTCTNKQCIPKSQRCDQIFNCVDKSDELFCNCSGVDKFLCGSGECLSKSLRCDKIRNCQDWSDETSCSSSCSSAELTCASGWCLYTTSQCVLTCPDVLCDGFIDCPDGSDERNCSDISKNTNQIPTSPTGSQTSDSNTLPVTRSPVGRCDYNDYECKNGQCVYWYYTCDRTDDCGDNSDETFCNQQSYKPVQNDFVLVTDTERPGVYQMDLLNGQVRQLLAVKPKRPVEVTYCAQGRSVIWTDSVERTVNKYSIITGRSHPIVKINGNSTLDGLSISEDCSLIFYTNLLNESLGQIGQIKQTTAGNVEHSILLSQTGLKPRAIVYNTDTRILYWTDVGNVPGIYRMSLNLLSNVSIIVSQKLISPTALAIDFTEGRMYWGDSSTHVLETSDLEGSDRRVISQGSVEQYMSITLTSNQILVSDWSSPTYIKIINRSTYDGNFNPQLKFSKVTGLSAYSVITDHSGCAISWSSQSGRTILGGQFYGNRSSEGECQGFCASLLQCTAISYSRTLGCWIHTRASVNKSIDADPDVKLDLIKRDCPSPAIVGVCGAVSEYQCDNGWCVSVKRECGDPWCPTSRLDCDGFNDCPDGSDESYCNNITNHTCSPGEYTCTNGNCVSYARLCTTLNLCGDGSELNYCSSLCSESEMLCNSTAKCVPNSKKCDGINDCGDFSDESGCVCNEATQFRCTKTGRCIPLNKKCDGVSDCSDDTDEVGCTSTTSCNHTTQAQCLSSGTCIPLSWKCDGFSDCSDNSDELNCSCSKEEFRCKNGQCVPLFYRCNGGMCLDGSDLLDCDTCAANEFRCADGTTCVNIRKWCDGTADCSDKSDEKDCATDPNSCPVGYFSCGLSPGPGSSSSSRQCLRQALMCDGVVDCPNNFDEINCPCSAVSDFRCSSGVCARGGKWCDGRFDCADQSDEPEDCQSKCNPHQSITCRNGRCVRAEDRCDGINNCGDYTDEIYCDACTGSFNSFTCDMGLCLSSEKFCNQVRDCPDGSDEPPHCEDLCSGSSFTCDNGRCIGKSFICNGFNNCGDYSDEINCTCSEDYMRCDMGLCIPGSYWCDGYRDCPDSSDEKPGCEKVCPVDSRLCRNTGECLRGSRLCDGFRDCPDGSDEQHCGV